MNQIIQIIVGIVVTLLLGESVRRLLNFAIPRPNRPTYFNKMVWDAMYKPDDAGRWIGRFERLLILMSFWIDTYAIIGGWLAFKLAAKWEAWRNVIKIPETLDEGIAPTEGVVPSLAWYEARVTYGSWLLSRFLVGTVLSVLIGAVGAYAGKHSLEFADWLCGRVGT
jgi:hypothetical protein